MGWLMTLACRRVRADCNQTWQCIRDEGAGQYEAGPLPKFHKLIHRFTACLLELYKTIPRDSVRLSSVRPPTVLHTSLDLFLIQLKVVRLLCAWTDVRRGRPSARRGASRRSRPGFGARREPIAGITRTLSQPPARECATWSTWNAVASGAAPLCQLHSSTQEA